MGDWHDLLLEDVADEITVGHVGPMVSEYVQNGIPFLRSKNVEPLCINRDKIKYISRSFHDRLRKSALSPGDVVIVRTGKPGACAVVPDWLPIANCSDLVIVRCGPKLNPRFLAYYVNSVAVHHVGAHLVGAVQQHFNVGSARKMLIRLPVMAEQQAIAEILGALDDKIELNRRMNETLEAMARVLFKSWFVDFDPVYAKAEGRQPAHMDADTAALLPDTFDDEGKPDGWRIGTVGKLAQLNKASVNPQECSDEAFDHYSIPAYDLGCFPAIEHGEAIKSNKILVRLDAILLSKLNPDIRRVWWPVGDQGRRAICSTEFLVLTPLERLPRSYLYSFFNSDEFAIRYEGLVTGTSKSHQRVKPDALLAMEVVMPTNGVIGAFDRFATPLFARLIANQHQNRTLADLRDTLLPKLMSGEIHVRDAEKGVEAVAK